MVHDPALRSLDAQGLAEIFSPTGGPAARTANYAPLHLLAHALELRAFGSETRGYHVVNVLLHALNALLLVQLLGARRTLAPGLAAFGGLFFLVHPANVEAVAWIFQLKTQLAFALSVGALLLRERLPALATGLFAAALLCKITAIFALPVAAAQAWTRPADAPGRAVWPWIGAWLGVTLLVSVPELAAFRHAGEFRAEDAPGLAERLPLILELVARYAVLALTSWGASTFHEPAAPESLLAPGPLLGLAVLLAAAGRGLWALARRRPEAAWWVWCAAGFLPVSQLFAFRFPMADRYLYFILPGLIGGLLAAFAPWLGRAPRAPRVAVAVVALLALGLHTHQRAGVWSSGEALVRDAARRYPDGVQAWLLRASERGQRGEGEGALEALEAAYRRGYADFETVGTDPAFALLRGDPRFLELRRRMAGDYLERVGGRPGATTADRVQRARAHSLRGEHQLALGTLERALAEARPGEQEQLRRELLRARGARERSRPR